MSETQNKTVKNILSAVNALLILLCFSGCVYVCFTGSGPYFTIAAVTEMLALVFSVLYYVYGYKKDAARYYRLFMLFYAFTYLAETAAGIGSYDSLGVSGAPYTVVFSMLLYGNTILLAAGKDLGKTVSYALCGVNVLFYALPMLAVLIPGINVVAFDSTAVEASSIILYATWLILALNAFVMTVAKYADKAERGSK